MATKKHLFLVAGLLLAPPASAHTLSQAIQLAMSQNPEILSAKQGVGVANEQVDQAKSGWLPTVDLAFDLGHEYKDKQGSELTRYAKNIASLTVNQPLYDGGATMAAVERSDQMQQVSSIHLDEIRSTVTLDAIEAWYEVYRLQREIRLTEANIREHEKLYHQTKQKVDAGGADKAELVAVESPWLLAKNALINARGDYKDALANYEKVVGVKPVTELRDGLAVTEALLPPSVGEALNVLNRNSYILRTAEANLTAARADYKGARSGLLPTLDLELKGGRKENDAGVIGVDQDYTALLKLNYNLFNGGADESYRREMARTMLDSQEQLALARRNMEEQLHQYWNGLEVSRGLLQTSEQQLAIAHDNFETAKEQFKLGEGDVKAIMAADDALLQARKAVLQDKIDTQLGVYRVLAHLGVLLDHLDVPEVEISDEDLEPFESDMLLVERVLERVEDAVTDLQTDGLEPLFEESGEIAANSVVPEPAEVESPEKEVVRAAAPEAPKSLSEEMKTSGWVVLNTVDEVKARSDARALERAQELAEEKRLEEQRAAELAAQEAAAQRAEDIARMKAMAHAAKVAKIKRVAEYPQRKARMRTLALQGRLDQHNRRVTSYRQRLHQSNQLLNQRRQELKKMLVAHDRKISQHNLQSVHHIKNKERKRIALSRSGVRQDAYASKVKHGLYRQASQIHQQKRSGTAMAIRHLNRVADAERLANQVAPAEEQVAQQDNGLFDFFSAD